MADSLDLFGQPVQLRPAFRNFWVVWSPEGRTPPQQRHASSARARREAERLAMLHPGAEFFVLRSESHSAAPRVLTTFAEMTDADIPF